MSCFDTEMERIKKKLFNMAMRGDWEDIARIYEEDGRAHNIVITRSGETALHLAVSNLQEAIVDKLVRRIISEPNLPVLEIRNNRGNTPLHFAASVGNVRMCECIAKVSPLLIGRRNNDCETPLLLAALRGKKDAFLCLHRICGSEHSTSYCRGKGGQTALHGAIDGEYFDLAFQIIQLYPELVNSVNEQGLSPLHILASKPFAFKSGSNLGLFDRIMYHCAFVDVLKPESPPQTSLGRERQEQKPNYPETCGICIMLSSFLMSWTRALTCIGPKTPKDRADMENALRTQEKGTPLRNEHKGNPMTTRIRRQKEKNIWSVQVLDELLTYASLYEYTNTIRCGDGPRVDEEHDAMETKPYEIVAGGHVVFSKGVFETPIPAPSTSCADSSNEKGGETSKPESHETAILIAAKNGISEMVEKLFQRYPVAINDLTAEDKNIVLLAVEHRQPNVLNLLQDKKFLEFDHSVFQQMDNKGNTALHLAAMLHETNPWPVPGAALQMQWEIKWFKFIKKIFPDDYRIRYNVEGKTPEDIFTETHMGLVQDSATWLNNISQACSVVAGLFVTMAFNTSVTVPGGARQETGTPYLENHLAFEFFAISSQFAFYSSVVSVVMFLAILTSGYQARDFDTTLPWKLLLGLTTLYISIASTLTSFCSAHFFILKSKLKQAASPVYIATCLVVTWFAIVQFPLYFQLVWATFKKVPQRSGRRAFARYFSF